MKKIRSLASLLIAAILISSPVFAGDKHATKDEAQAMATKAAELVKKDGDKAFAAFNKGGEWRNGDLYVFVIDKTGTWKASGARPELVGKNDLNTPDANGKLFVKEVVAIDKNGWVDYKFKSPADNQDHDKSSYFVRVGDFLVGAGAYKY
jgi:cytochrome c